MLDTEKTGELEDFRDEIKKLREKNESLKIGIESIEGIDELGGKELEVWKEFKELFKLLDLFFQKNQTITEVHNSEKELRDLFGEFKKLSEVISDYLKEADVKMSVSRKEFFAWVRNDINIVEFFSFLLPEDAEHELEAEESDLNHAREKIKRKKKDLGIE